MKAKLGRWSIPEFIKGFFLANFGSFYLKNSNAGKSYLRKLVELSDNLTLDGRINTVISGTRNQREKLIEYLDEVEAPVDCKRLVEILDRFSDISTPRIPPALNVIPDELKNMFSYNGR